VVWGAAVAITMRIVLTLTAVALLTMPYLKLIGSVFLMWIGIRLIDADEGESDIEPGRRHPDNSFGRHGDEPG
jgi:predicted tellurium resistance membrane protein TerC